MTGETETEGAVKTRNEKKVVDNKTTTAEYSCKCQVMNETLIEKW